MSRTRENINLGTVSFHHGTFVAATSAASTVFPADNIIKNTSGNDRDRE